MYGITTLARLNRQADEAHRILRAHNLGGSNHLPAQPIVTPQEPHKTIERILAGARG